MANNIKVKLAYKNTDFTRQLTMSDVADSVLSSVENKIESINTSLAGGTAGGLSTFFVSDDFDSENNVGNFVKISEAKIETIIETPIPLGG